MQLFMIRFLRININALFVEEYQRFFVAASDLQLVTKRIKLFNKNKNKLYKIVF